MKVISVCLPLLYLAAACGGKVVFDEPGGAGEAAAPSQTSATTPSTTSVAVTVGESTSSGVQDCEQYGFNGIGAACGQEGVACLIPRSCCATMTARCANGTWALENKATCGDICLPCFDGLSCKNGALCVSDALPNTTDLTAKCVENSCANQPLVCECAQAICALDSLNCLGTGSIFVNCG